MKNVAQRKKRDFAKLVKYLIYLFALHFAFFAYICNVFGKEPGDNLLFLYKSFFNRESYLSLPILIAVVMIMAVNEDFLIGAVKKAFWSVPFIIVYEIFMYTWNYLFYRNLAEELLGQKQVGVNDWFDPVVKYFTTFDGYLNTLIIFIIVVGSAILGAFLKIKYREKYKKRSVERNEFS